MMYENARYAKDPIFGEINTILVDIGGVSSAVPLDPANSDYVAIMALVEAGELTIAPAE